MVRSKAKVDYGWLVPVSELQLPTLTHGYSFAIKGHNAWRKHGTHTHTRNHIPTHPHTVMYM